MFLLKIKGSYAFLIPTYSTILAELSKAMTDDKIKNGKELFRRCL